MAMHQTDGQAGPVLRDGTRVLSLFYADDGTLLANNAPDMRKLCACLDAFCRRAGMRVNLAPGKTEMMIFGVSPARRTALMAAHPFSLGGQLIRLVHQYKYLGCMIHERNLFSADFAKRRSQLLLKTLMLRRVLSRLGAAKSLSLGFRLYDVQARPAALYGSCVWSTRFCNASPDSCHVLNAVERCHLDFIRQWCGLRGHEPNWLIYRHLGRLPFHYFWWRDVIRFVNALHCLPIDSIWRKMMLDSELSAQQGVRCWAADIFRFLRDVNYRGITTPEQRVDEKLVLAALCRRYDAVRLGLGADPRQVVERARFATYFAWLDSGSWLARPKYLLADFSASSTSAYMRFMLGSHSLQVNEGRWEGGVYVPHADRICRRCAMHAPDDERHLVFECPCLEYIRAQWPELFSARVGSNMKAFFNQKDRLAVFGFVLQCLRKVRDFRADNRSADVFLVPDWFDDYDSSSD